ncbi:MAG: hypothetical protein FWG63_06655, partial [Defluviitaleaceae bacterium]|nr:hypothetical protein [Defluviitaleaceae bacterium]
AEKGIEDKSIIKNICEEQEEISMAVSALVRLSEDKVTRQAYQRRQDDIMLAAKKANDYKLLELRAEQNRRRAEQDRHRAEQAESALAEKDVALADAESALVQKGVALADKDAALADKDAIIAELRSQLGKK